MKKISTLILVTIIILSLAAPAYAVQSIESNQGYNSYTSSQEQETGSNTEPEVVFAPSTDSYTDGPISSAGVEGNITGTMAIDNLGRVYFINDNCLREYDPATQEINTIGMCDTNLGISVTSNNKSYQFDQPYQFSTLAYDSYRDSILVGCMYKNRDIDGDNDFANAVFEYKDGKFTALLSDLPGHTEYGIDIGSFIVPDANGGIYISEAFGYRPKSPSRLMYNDTEIGKGEYEIKYDTDYNTYFEVAKGSTAVPTPMDSAAILDGQSLYVFDTCANVLYKYDLKTKQIETIIECSQYFYHVSAGTDKFYLSTQDTVYTMNMDGSYEELCEVNGGTEGVDMGVDSNNVLYYCDASNTFWKVGGDTIDPGTEDEELTPEELDSQENFQNSNSYNNNNDSFNSNSYNHINSHNTDSYNTNSYNTTYVYAPVINGNNNIVTINSGTNTWTTTTNTNSGNNSNNTNSGNNNNNTIH